MMYSYCEVMKGSVDYKCTREKFKAKRSASHGQTNHSSMTHSITVRCYKCFYSFDSQLQGLQLF